MLLKLESLQVTNSFKVRGALNAVLALVGERPATGLEPAAGGVPWLVTASAGNHGRALAYAAEQLGLKVTIFTRRTAPMSKLGPIRRHGADLRAEAEDYDETERLAKDLAAREGAAFVSAYNHPDIIAGAGTVALEILEDCPEVGQIVVPLGGGGLLAGTAVVVKSFNRQLAVVGAEAKASPAFHTSLAEGRIVEVDVKPSLADGLVGNMDPDNIAFGMVRELVDELVQVTESQFAAAVRALVAEEHLVAEAAGAAGVAAILAGHVRGRRGPTVVIVSGANIDSNQLASLLTDS